MYTKLTVTAYEIEDIFFLRSHSTFKKKTLLDTKIYNAFLNTN